MPGIVLTTINARYIHAALGLRWLYANLRELQPQTCIQEYSLTDQISDIAEKILAGTPAIVGIGVYIWNATQVRQLINLLKQVSPATRIVLGGPEVSHPPLRVDLSGADYMIQGEGEIALYQLCTALLAGRPPAAALIPATPVAVEELTLPYDFYTDEDLAHRLTYVEASRGCPFTCEFCLSSLDKKVRFFAVDPFLAALETLWQRGARTFKFVDRTFNCNPAMAGRILDFFLAKTPPYHVHFEVIPEHFPAALKKQLARFAAGTLQLEVGIQTLQPAVAANISRPLDFARIRENLQFLQEHTTAHLHVDLIIGLPGESIEQFGENLNSLMALSRGEVQLGVLKKLSGTAINRHDRQYGMVYSQDPPYEILQNHLIPFTQMQTMKRMARFWDLVYNSGNFQRTAPLLWPDGDVFHGFLDFCQWLYGETRATWQIGLPRLAELLFRYLVEHQGRDRTEVADCLAADILVIKGRVLPPSISAHVSCQPDQRHNRADNLTKRQGRHREGADRG